jgi:O-antigen ligase
VTLPSRARTLSVVFLAVFLWSDPFSITVAESALALSAACYGWALWQENGWRRVQLPLIVPFLLFAAITVASVFVSVDRGRSVLGLKSLLLVVAFYLAANVVTSESTARVLLAGFLASAAVSSLVGLSASYTHGISYRVHSTLSIYMTLAGILAVALLLAAACCIALRGTERRVATILAVPIAVALLLTYTRNAWLGFVIGLALLVVALGRRWAIGLVGVAIAATLAGAVVVPPLAVRVKSMADLSDPTFVERVQMWRTGVLMIRDHPWLGVGVKMPEARFREYRVPDFTRERIAHMHSDVMQITAERGFLGLGAWLLIWIAFFTRLFGLRARVKTAATPLTEAVWAWSGAAVVAVLVGGLFQYNFGDSEIIMIVYFAMGLPFGLVTARAAEPSREAGPVRVATGPSLRRESIKGAPAR